MILAQALKSGASRSCGCRTEEQNQKVSERMTTHGRSNSKAWLCWREMRYRCQKPKDAAYRYYGARGITVCDAWASFARFLLDMGDPLPGMTLERIDNDRGYEPGNCRWATRKEQANNTRRNIVIEHAGKTQTMSQWAQEMGLRVGTLWRRLQLGWSVERALKERLR